jgi:hypothetical protein
MPMHYLHTPLNSVTGLDNNFVYLHIPLFLNRHRTTSINTGQVKSPVLGTFAHCIFLKAVPSLGKNLRVKSTYDRRRAR